MDGAGSETSLGLYRGGRATRRGRIGGTMPPSSSRAKKGTGAELDRDSQHPASPPNALRSSSRGGGGSLDDTSQGMDLESLLKLFRRMVLIREFETRAGDCYRDGEIPGFVHLSIGQEASAVGACWPLGSKDIITSTHRGHGHCLAKGLDPEAMFAELMGKATGTCRGRGGSMHIASPRSGIFGANGVVAGGLPIATGAATASAILGDGRIVVAFFGDGAAAAGAFHEAVNLAALWHLPVVFFCENNQYAEFSRAADQHPVSLSKRAQGYGIPFVELPGNNVEAVAQAMTAIVARVRDGDAPIMVEAHTYRIRGHYEGDPERYRAPEEVKQWEKEDPIARAGDRLAQLGVSPEELESIEREVGEELDQALGRARAAPAPNPDTVLSFVTVDRTLVPEPDPLEGPSEELKTMDAIREALERELESDPDVFLAGVDVGTGGNVFGLTRGLKDRWPERVRDTPISEIAVLGVAIGASMAGMRPVVEVMYMDFIGVCFDMLLNQAAKLPFMTGGEALLPLVVRTQFGAGRSSGSQHSQSLEALLAHIPGLTVVVPSTPAETYGLLRAAIHDPNPVVFVENRLLYGKKGPRPPKEYLVPIGEAKVVRPGRDVTIVSFSRMVWEALTAAETLAGEGIDAEVIDLRTIVPLDRATILASLEKTGRLVVAHEAVTDFGVGAEIAAVAAGEGFWHLDAPIRRVGSLRSPPPYAPDLEKAWLPDHGSIVRAVQGLLAE
jgi:2-oxoisovalerate dehydrogenase E1 component